MSKRILVVDHDEATLEALELALRRAGLEPVAAPDALSALIAFREETPAAVLISIDPRGEAIGLAADLRKERDGAIIPILFMGEAATDDVVRSPSEALAVGGDYFFKLPTDLDYLAGRILGWTGDSLSTRPGRLTGGPPVDDLSLPFEELNDEVTELTQPLRITDPPRLPPVLMKEPLDEAPTLGLTDAQARPEAGQRRSGSGKSPKDRQALEMVKEGERLRTTGNIEAAVDAYATAAEVYESSDRVDPALALYKLIVHLDPSRVELALHAVELAKAHDKPKDALELLRRPARALEAAERWDEAASLLREIITLAPSDPALLLKLASLESKAREAARPISRPSQAPILPPTPLPLELPPLDPPEADGGPLGDDEGWDAALAEELARSEEALDPLPPPPKLSVIPASGETASLPKLWDAETIDAPLELQFEEGTAPGPEPPIDEHPEPEYVPVPPPKPVEPPRAPSNPPAAPAVTKRVASRRPIAPAKTDVSPPPVILRATSPARPEGPLPRIEILPRPSTPEPSTVEPEERPVPPVAKVEPPTPVSESPTKPEHPVLKIEAPPAVKIEAPPVVMIDPVPVPKIEPPVAKVEPPVAKVEPPVAKVEPPVAEVEPPIEAAPVLAPEVEAAPPPKAVPVRPLLPAQGTLQNLGDLLTLFAQLRAQRATGLLHAEGLATYVIVHGEPAALRGDLALETLQVLLEPRLLAHTPIPSPDDRPVIVGRELVRKGRLRERECFAFLHHHLELGLLALLRHRGAFRFEAGPHALIFPEELVPEPAPTFELLADLLPWVSPAPELLAGLGGPDARLRAAVSGGAPSARDSRFYAFLDGSYRLEDAARLSMITLERAGALAVLLVGFGRAAVVPSKATRPAGSARPAPAWLPLGFGPEVPLEHDPILPPSKGDSADDSLPPAPIPHAPIRTLDADARVRALAELVRTSDYFTILGLDAQAGKNAIDQAHHQLRSMIRIDDYPEGSTLAAMAKEVTRSLDEARDVLKIPELRAAYLKHLRP